MGTMSVADDTCLFDFTRSTKCASKQRRDQINSEIAILRDLLPIAESARVRLSQLQIMSLTCVYIRKCVLLERVFGDVPFNISTPFDFFQALSGFLLVTTQEGKLVYISENVTEHLGHSMIDMKMQGDSIYDIIDKRDHASVQAQLTKADAFVTSGRDSSFFCRMNMSRCLKRQASPADIKIMHVKGHFKTVPSSDAGQGRSLFMAICCPLLTPDVKENMIQHNTMIFRSSHSLDMKYKHISQTGEQHLGLTNKVLSGQSWYSMIHPEDCQEAHDRHIRLLSSQNDHGCLLTVRMITATMETLWVNVVMSVHQSQGQNAREATIVCINQVISEQEAPQFRMHSQVYNMYQSRSVDMMYNSMYAPVVGTSANILDSFMDQVSERTAPVAPPTASYTQTFVPAPLKTGTAKAEPPRNVASSVRKIEHAQAMKALKRKLGENAMSPTNKAKIPCFSKLSSSGDEATFDVGQLASFNNGSAEATSLMSPLSPVFRYDCGNALLSPVHQSATTYKIENVGGGIVISEARMHPIAVDVAKGMKTNQEQVVPDWYLTPEASPTGSPNITDADVRAFAKSLDAQLQMEFKTEIKREMHLSCDHERKSSIRELPVIDASVVDEFFDQVASPTKSADSPPPSCRQRTISNSSSNQVAPDNSFITVDDLLDFSSFLSDATLKDETHPSVASPLEIMDSAELISEEEAQATLSLLNLPAPLLAPHRNMIQLNRTRAQVANLSHVEGMSTSPRFEHTCQ